MNRPRFAPVFPAMFALSLLACSKPSETATTSPDSSPSTAPEAEAQAPAVEETPEVADPIEVSIKTIYVVRHAEKQVIKGERDPELTAEGQARAATLPELLKDAKVEAVYSSPYKRTQQTVAPVAEAMGVSVTAYDPSQHPKDFAETLRQDEAKTILVAGHSNTIPPLLAAFGATVPAIDDSQYGDMFVITIDDDKVDVNIEHFGQ